VSPLEAARRHLAKADEFLSAAGSALQSGHLNVATSNAVIAGINAKDAICLALVGKTSKSDDHTQAVPELRKAGKAGAELASTLDRLLKPRTRAQYQTISMAQKEAEIAVRQAGQLVAGARALLS
jgi:uncharacterized protein (UPF0332 family)